MSRKNIILDLDETLIYADATEDFDLNDYKKKFKSQLASGKEPFTYHNMDDYYLVFERPHLQEFLDYAFKNFNVSIWTAASKDYALFIIKNIIIGNHKDRKLDFIFFNFHCNCSKKHNKKTKNLRMLWDVYHLPGYNNQNTFIMDDYSEVYDTQSDNCIIAEEFSIHNNKSEKDDFLKRAIPVLEQIKNHSDISPVITEFNNKNKSLQ
jgi:TFIIF-interacting CTD phosphatase-like protein